MNPAVCTALLISAAAAAQTVTVFPADHASREGSSSVTNRPLSGGISRVQLIYSNWRTQIPNNAQIRRIGLRPDMAGTGAGRQLQMEIWMGHSTRIHAGASTTFDTNYDSGPAVRVYDLKTFAMPTVPAVPAGPNPTIVWIPLDRNFTYDNTKNLVVEYRITANNNGNAAFTYSFDFASFASATTTFGTACPTSSNRMPAVATDPAQIGSSMGVSLTNAPASSGGALIIGLSNTTWGSVPLPLSLASLGAGTCSLQVSIDTTAPIFTGTSGSFSASLPVPNVLALHGVWIYAQAAIGDLFANAAGFVTSRSAGSQFAALPQATIIAAIGNASATTGSRTVNYGLVSVFEY